MEIWETCLKIELEGSEKCEISGGHMIPRYYDCLMKGRERKYQNKRVSCFSTKLHVCPSHCIDKNKVIHYNQVLIMGY